MAAQTFGDGALERELLGLFVAQARRVVPTLPSISAGRQADAAHLLKGSARGIGAWAAAAAAETYEQASAAERPLAYAALTAAFAAVETAITDRLAGKVAGTSA